jgi:hypothetical protein
MSSFEWNEKKTNAAILLAQGYLIKEVAKSVDVNEKTIDRWKGDIEFSKEVDRLSLMLDISSRAERMRIAMRMVRKALKKKTPTRRDLLEWLKFAQGETDGIKLDLTSLLDAHAPLAGSGQDGSGKETGTEPK